MVSHRAGGELHAIADDIVLVCQNVKRLLGVECLQTALRHGKRIVCKADLLCLGIPLKHGEIIHIAETERILFVQIQLLSQLISDLSCIIAGALLLISNKEDRISCGKSRQPCKLALKLIRDKLIDRPFVGHILRHLQITEAAHSQRNRKRQQLLVEALGHFRMHLDGADCSADEGLEGTFLEEIRQIHDPQRITQVGLVAAELQHCLSVTDYRVGCRRHNCSLRCKFCKGLREHLLANAEHILLGGEAHLKIKLVKFSGRAVGAGVLIAEAGRNLEILVKARRHQKLLILLGRLRQRIKLALELSGGHDIVSCSLRGRSAQDGCLDFQKAHLRHLLTKESDHLGAENDVVPHLCVSQIQITVFQADILPDLLGGHHLKGKLLIHPAEHRNLLCLKFNGTGGNPGVVGLLIPVLHLSAHGDTHLLRDALQQLGLADHNLQHTVHVAQVDERNTAVIPDIFYPARHLQYLVNVLLSDFLCCQIPIHILSSLSLCDPQNKKSRNTESFCIPGRIYEYIRGTTRIDKPTLPSKRLTGLPSLACNVCKRTALRGKALRQSAPECSLYRFPQTALSVGDAVFLLLSVARVSFNAFPCFIELKCSTTFF